MKKDTYYFSHDYNAASDYKVLYLRQQLGMEGYGIFWYLIEQLAQSGGQLPVKIIPVLAMQMQVTETKVAAVINSFELFTISGESFESNRLNRHLIERNSFSEFGKKGALTRWKNRGAINPAINPPINPANAKERKEKEIKEKDNIRFDFKKSLIELNIDTKLVDEWIKVRKAKRAVNTETAFNRFVIEVNKSSATHNEAVKMCVEKSWAGFEADWYEKNKPQPKQQTTLYKKL